MNQKIKTSHMFNQLVAKLEQEMTEAEVLFCFSKQMTESASWALLSEEHRRHIYTAVSSCGCTHDLAVAQARSMLSTMPAFEVFMYLACGDEMLDEVTKEHVHDNVKFATTQYFESLLFAAFGGIQNTNARITLV